MQDNSVRFYHLRDENNKPVATVASIYLENVGGKGIKLFGASKCSDLDHFNKRLGRTIAKARAEKLLSQIKDINNLDEVVSKYNFVDAHPADKTDKFDFLFFTNAGRSQFKAQMKKD
jgi:hypothetical protein